MFLTLPYFSENLEEYVFALFYFLLHATKISTKFKDSCIRKDWGQIPVLFISCMSIAKSLILPGLQFLLLLNVENNALHWIMYMTANELVRIYFNTKEE